jgi:hypothetical protein
MYEANAAGITRNLAGVLAAAIVAVSGLVFDRSHLASAPEGTVEVGELALIEAPIVAAAQPATIVGALPEVVVTARKA